MKFANGLNYTGSTLVQILAPPTGGATNGSVIIGPQNLLRNKKIVAIRTMQVANVPKSPNDSTALINANVYKSAFFWLLDGDPKNSNNVILSNTPWRDADPDANNNGEMLYLYDKTVNWDTSKINIADMSTLAGAATPECFLFEVFYKD